MTKMTVGEVARLTGVSVRTLHHYDEIGLLEPATRNYAGYRLYDDETIARLHQILVMRELGLSLDVIAKTMDDPSFDVAGALERQLHEIEREIDRLDNVRRSVTAMLANMKRGTTMANDEIADMFEGFDPLEHEEEARDRWGDTDAYEESARRTKSYTRDDWQIIKAEIDEIESGFADALAAGIPVDDETATDLAERHRLHIDRWFYPCSHDMQLGLAEMYVADPRFAEHYDRRRDGLARYVADAIGANASQR